MWYGLFVNIDNSSFLTNSAGSWGGGAYVYSFNISITNSFCSKNTAVHASAFFINQFATVSVYNLTIDKSSTAWGLGGMFYFYNGNSINISNSSFLKSNTIPWSIPWVGGVFAIDRNNSFTMANVRIEDSLSANTGGVFYIFSKNSVYLYNITLFNSVTNGAEGGVFYVGDSNMLYINNMVSNISTSGNIAGFLGTETYNNVTLIGVTVLQSTAVTGGVIYSNKNNTYYIDGCQFLQSNSTKESGMLGTWTLNYLVLNNSIFNNSFSVASGFSYLISYNTFTAQNCSFHGFSATGFGGVLGTSQSNIITLSSSSFTNSYCAGSGGVIYLEATNQLIAEYVVFKNSTAGLSGGILVINNQNPLVKLSFCQFIDTIALNNLAGAMFIVNGNVLLIQNCIFNNSRIAIHGSGGVFLLSASNSMTLMNNTYVNCQSPGFGGIGSFGQTNNYAEINSSFINISIVNTASFTHDGAIFQIGSSNIFTIQNCQFINISTQNSGGVFYLSLLNTLLVSNCNFSNVSVNFAGALLYAEEQNTCVFQLNTASLMTGNLFGTAIYALFSNTIMMVALYAEKIFNFGSSGGFAYFKDQNNIMLTDSIISNLSAKSSGALFYAEIDNSYTINNISASYITTGDAGALCYFSRNNQLTMNSSIISGINTGFRGGVVFATGNNTMVFGNVQFLGLTGLDMGAIFYLTSLNTIIIEDSLLNDSISAMAPGNAIFLADDNTLSMKNTSIHNYQALGDVDYFLGRTNNVINLDNISLSSAFSQMFFNLQLGNSLFAKDIRVLSNSSFNTFVYLQGGTLNITRLTMVFKVNHAVFHIMSSSGWFKDLRLITASVGNMTPTSQTSNSSSVTANNIGGIDFQTVFGDFLVFFLAGSQVSISRSSLTNTKGLKLNFISAAGSQISLFKVLVIGTLTTHPGAVAQLFDSSIKSYRCVAIESKALSGGCIYMNFSQEPTDVNVSQTTTRLLQQVQQTAALKIIRNSFPLNTARLQGGVIRVSVSPSISGVRPLMIDQNKFSYDKAWTGGAVDLENVQGVKLTNNSFTNNKVETGSFTDADALKLYYTFANQSQAKGGALHTTNSSGIQSSGNIFTGNIGNVGGAIYSSTMIISKNDSFANNSATFFGVNSASLVKSLTFILKDSLYGSAYKFTPIYYTTLENIVPGSNQSSDPTSNCLVTIAGIDSLGNLVFNIDQEDPYTSNIRFVSTNSQNPSYTANLITQVRNGQLCILGGSRDQLPLAEEFSFNVIFNNQPTNLTLDVKFRECGIGERLTDNYQCVDCSSGFYSFQTVFTETSICLPCADNDPFVCLGGNKLSPKPGYWRSDANSKNFLKCPKADACVPYNDSLYLEAQNNVNQANQASLNSDLNSLEQLGALNNLFFTGDCQTGFTGPFCNICDTQYGKMGQLNCILCADSSWFYYFLIILQIVLKVWYLFYCVLMAFKMIISITMKSASEGAVVALNMLKILLIHIQILSFILKMPLSWSDTLKTYLPLLFSFNPDISESFNFECFMKSLGWTLSEQYFILILCPIYILLIFFISLIFVAARKNSSKNPAVQALSNLKLGFCVFFIIMILTYIDLSKVNLEMFQCLNIADPSTPDYRLVNDVGVDCNSVLHDLWKYILAVPMLFICVLLVIFIVGKLTISFYKGNIDNRSTKLEFGYFYYAYKRKYFFWDFVILIRRLLILFFFLFFYEDLTSKRIFPILLMVLTLFLSLSLQIYIHPFETEYELINDAEQFSLITLCLSYVIMMMYATFYFNDYNIPESLFLLTTLSILMINVAYLLYWTQNYYVFYFSKKLRTFVKALKDTVRADGAVWLEKLQKEHHIIFKVHNYLFKKQYLLGDASAYSQQFNAFYSDADRTELNQTGLYAHLLSKTLKTSSEVPTSELKGLVEADDALFQVRESRTKEIENMWTDGHALKLRLTRQNLKAALFGEEVTLYESPMGKFKICYKKVLKGRNYYTYQLINEIKVIGQLEGEIANYDLENKKSIYNFVP